MIRRGIMHQLARWLMPALVLSAVASAQKVKVEYNKDENFNQYKTYSWVERDQYIRPLLAAVVIGAVDTQMQAKGLKKVERGGDLVVAAYGAIDTELSIAGMPDVIYYFPPVYGNPWWGSAMYMPGSSTAVYIPKGTLVVDLADPHTKQLRWRGIANAKLDPQQKEKSLQKIEKSVEKMFDKYPGKPAQ
jgi:hypothetical protein